MSIQPFVDAIEWEPLSRPIEAPIVRAGSVTGNLGTLRVERDAEYRLSVSVNADDDAAWTKPHLEGVPGVVNEGVEIEAEDLPGRKFILTRAIVMGAPHSTSRGRTSARVKVRAHSLVRNIPQAGRASLLVDWFLSGPGASMWIFLRTTERQRSEAFARTRLGSSKEIEHKFASGVPAPVGSVASGGDHLVLDLPQGPVRVCKVRKEYGPDWAHPIALEYPCEESEPPQDLRDGVVEALGFLFGRHVLRVGTTAYNADGYATRWEAISPWGGDAGNVASRPDLPVFPIGASPLGTPAEQVLSPVVAKFLAARDELDLGHVVWMMWIASRMPLTFDVPIYAAALEALTNAWFTSQHSATRGEYMPKAEFRERFARPLAGFDAVVARGVPYGDRIVRRVNGANTMGVNERFEVFLEELGLPIDKGERAVIQARNITAHGGRSSRPPQDSLWVAAGYRTLLNRAILKALGYAGQYVDYSTVEHPERAIDEPIGYRPQR